MTDGLIILGTIFYAWFGFGFGLRFSDSPFRQFLALFVWPLLVTMRLGVWAGRKF